MWVYSILYFDQKYCLKAEGLPVTVRTNILSIKHRSDIHLINIVTKYKPLLIFRNAQPVLAEFLMFPLTDIKFL